MDIRSDEALIAACKLAEVDHADPEWRAELKGFLEEVQSADLKERASEAFQRRLWDENPVTYAGRGEISVDRAIADLDFRMWMAKQSLRELPEDLSLRTAMLSKMHKGILGRLEPFCSDRMPRLKVLRVMAALFPEEFTTLANVLTLQHLQPAMQFPRRVDPVFGNRKVLDRLNEVLGVVDPDDFEALVKRMTLPWMISEVVKNQEPKATPEAKTSGNEWLKPLPASRRLKGLQAISGHLETILSMLEFIRDEPQRNELVDYVRAESPQLKEASIGIQINSLRSGFGVIRLEGERYKLTERGEGLLETGDPDELKDWLLTRVLGVDHLLVALHGGPLDRNALYQTMNSANPNLTSNFVGSAMVQWLVALMLIEQDESGLYLLTDRGREWHVSIHWEPECLAAPDADPVIPPPTRNEAALIRPELNSILEHMDGGASFPPELITSLHMGLWANERRHFAILTGLSGSGKTLLALKYARALTGSTDEFSQTISTVPVQPGWYDPTPLLGYVNPLTRDAYESTGFLDLLIHAVEHPEQPHVAILDEMNLSHPEQYLAPLLSAMETGDALQLHNRGEHFNEVPRRIPYPGNLVLIGTVNMDETTLGLSDKVLDRAFTLEFWDIDIDQWPEWGKRGLSTADEALVKKVLHGLMDALKPARMHFGWRVINEIVGFLALRDSEGGGLALEEALDRVIYAKLLPKLRGEDAPRFRKALDECSNVLREYNLNISRRKTQELKDDLETIGSARFWR